MNTSLVFIHELLSGEERNLHRPMEEPTYHEPPDEHAVLFLSNTVPLPLPS